MSTLAMDNPLLLPDHVYELRAPKTRQGTVSGYFDNADLLYNAVAELDGKVPGLYMTLNPVNPALLARAKNRLQTHAKSTTSDVDILRRCWILIDCDAVRPADISSSDPEHQAALDRIQTIQVWLTKQGWPDPVVADSGNGGHLLYRIDLPNDSDSLALVKAVLEVLAFKFSDGAVVVDTSVGNAARITKLYGTKTGKGDSTEDRPHRRSQILHTPDEIHTVSLSLLTALAQHRPVDQKPVYPPVNGVRFDLQSFMSRHHLTVVREKPWGNGATVYELESCPFNPEHERSASIVQFPSGAVSFQCFHNSCHTYRWQELRNLLEPDRRPHGASSSSSLSPEPGHADYTLTTADTVTMKPVKWVIQGRMPLGMLTVVAGRGAMAKSTLAAAWAAQVTDQPGVVVPPTM